MNETSMRQDITHGVGFWTKRGLSEPNGSVQSSGIDQISRQVSAKLNVGYGGNPGPALWQFNSMILAAVQPPFVADFYVPEDGYLADAATGRQEPAVTLKCSRET